MTRRMRRLAAATIVLGLLGAACTSDPEESAEDDAGNTAGEGTTGEGTTGTSVAGDEPEQLEGSTRGVTDDTIKIGYLGNDFGALAEAGIAPDLGDQTKTIPAIVDEINATGGVAGRQIEVEIQIADFAAGPQAAEAACLALTQDFGAFAVIVAPAVSRAATRCVTAANETLAIASTGWDRAMYEEAEGRLFTVGTQSAMSTNRQYEAWGQLMHDEGVLDGKTIGVVTSDGSPEFVAGAKEGLLPRLEELGHEVTVEIVLPCPEGDSDCEQHEGAVQRMKDAGVDFVFMSAANLAGATFVQAAKNLDFRPQWAANGSQVTDTVAGRFFAGVKDWWDGAIGVSTVFEADRTQTAADCNEIAARSGERYEPDEDAYGFTALSCTLFLVLQQGGEALEGDLNDATLIRAIETLDEVPMISGPPGSLAPDKHDAGDYVHLADFDAGVGLFVRREGEPFRVPG